MRRPPESRPATVDRNGGVDRDRDRDRDSEVLQARSGE
jgi:hypothetical protein